MMSMLNLRSLTVATAFLAVSGCAAISGTAGMADSSRTGVIHDVKFEDRMTPNELRVERGDEVRWINQRSDPVKVEFLEGGLDDVVCQSGFSSMFRRQQESTTIEPNETASLCFGESGTVRYNARMESAVAGGEEIESGRIEVSR